MTHPAICTLPSALQLCYKLLGILQTVTKRQKVHISSPNGLKRLHNINFAWLRPQSFLERKHSSRNFPFPDQIFWTKNIPSWLTFQQRPKRKNCKHLQKLGFYYLEISFLDKTLAKRSNHLLALRMSIHMHKKLHWVICFLRHQFEKIHSCTFT